jgi:hypothetical protein
MGGRGREEEEEEGWERNRWEINRWEGGRRNQEEGSGGGGPVFLTYDGKAPQDIIL